MLWCGGALRKLHAWRCGRREALSVQCTGQTHKAVPCCLGQLQQPAVAACLCCLPNTTPYTAQDLKESLAELGSLSADLIVAVELLWTPQERGDSYSKDELLIDYPGLVNL